YLGVQSLYDAGHPFEHQLLDPDGFLDPCLQLVAGGEEEQVRRCDTVNRSDEGHGDALPHQVDVVEVLHYLDQAEDRSDDADGRGVAAGGFVDLGFSFPLPLLRIEFNRHDAAQLLDIGTVHTERERLLQKRVGDPVDFRFQGDDAVAAGPHGEL